MDIIDKILLECQEDYVGLWSIMRAIKPDGVEYDAFDEEAQAIIIKLLSKCGVVAGHFDDGLFKVWKILPSEVVTRIQHEWTKLGRIPDIGDIVWFTKLSID
jgi:hypothetical protein